MIKQTIITILLLLTTVNGWAQKVWTNPSRKNVQRSMFNIPSLLARVATSSP